MEHDGDAAYARYQEGRSALERGDLQEALSALCESGSLSPHFKTYELAGETLLKLERPKDAVLYLAAAVGIGRRQFRARYLLAQALLALGEHEDAAEMLREALDLNPHYVTARRLLESLGDEAR